MTNQPTDGCENVTNEPTLAADVGLESPTCMEAPEQNSTIDPTDARKIITNEPTVDCEILTNEATVGRENTTNEPTHAVIVECGPAEGSAGMNDGAENEFDEVIDRQKSLEWNRAGLVRMVTPSAEKGWSNLRLAERTECT